MGAVSKERVVVFNFLFKLCLLRVSVPVFNRFACGVKEVKFATWWHQFEHFYNDEFLLAENYFFTNFRTMILIQDSAGMSPSCDHVANFKNSHATSLGNDEILPANPEGKIRCHITHDDVPYAVVLFTKGIEVIVPNDLQNRWIADRFQCG